ncbi:Hpt domain-containing protein [Massilia violaceinigra]|uniref:Hpt domain-containing protein n=1 Tax=Massilia violaceinigra TaxID=2045208 RepID=A0ABY4A2K2_9BURK|nr:Hpt domain-containing protein [Massilia violaceinigra]UOD28982.1 Hpt domain-containing protein [Massilia violaceinigra]
MATLIDQAFFARLHALNEKFAASVPATLARLEALRAQFDPAAADAALVKELHQSLHTIAGSAATFGFRVFGAQARQLEQRLRVLMAFELIAPKDWNDWLVALDEYIVWARQDPKAATYPGQPG